MVVLKARRTGYDLRDHPLVIRMIDPQPGRQLRAIRKQRGLSQSQFAKLLGCDSSNLSAMELGKRGVPWSVHEALHKLGERIDATQ